MVAMEVSVCLLYTDSTLLVAGPFEVRARTQYTLWVTTQSGTDYTSQEHAPLQLPVRGNPPQGYGMGECKLQA